MSLTCLLAQGAPASEAELKSVFLLNFVKYVEWPPRAFMDETSPVWIGVLGRDPLGAELEATLRDKRVRGRPLRVRRFGRPRDIFDVHLLFIPRSEEGRIEEVLARVKDGAVLLVGESRGFCRLGGTLSVIIENGRPVVEANPEAAARADLTIDARLLRVSQVIRGTP